MELQRFISSTICEILRGVQLAQEESKDVRAKINPSGTVGPTDKQYDEPTKTFVQSVDFDIAITLEKSSHTDGKLGVYFGPIKAGMGGESENNTTAVNRVRFSVPVTLPTT